MAKKTFQEKITEAYEARLKEIQVEKEQELREETERQRGYLASVLEPLGVQVGQPRIEIEGVRIWVIDEGHRYAFQAAIKCRYCEQWCESQALQDAANLGEFVNTFTADDCPRCSRTNEEAWTV